MDKYEEVDKARGLLRQGQHGEALKILDNLCDNWDTISPDEIEEESLTLELEFHPRRDEVPHFFVDDGCLCIDDDGWEIGNDTIKYISKNVSDMYLAGVSDVELRAFIRETFEDAIKSGKVRRKSNGETL